MRGLIRPRARSCCCSRLCFCRFLRGQRRLGSQSNPLIRSVDTHRPQGCPVGGVMLMVADFRGKVNVRDPRHRLFHGSAPRG